MTQERIDAETMAFEVLGRALLQIIDALPEHPGLGDLPVSLADDLSFATRLIEALEAKLDKSHPGHERACQLLDDQSWRFQPPGNIDPATLSDDDVYF